MKPLGPLLFALCVLTCRFAHAGSATWNLSPTDNLWHTAANWTPATVPNDDADTATFGASNTTTILINEYGTAGFITTVDKLIFEEGASSYTIKIIPDVSYQGAY